MAQVYSVMKHRTNVGLRLRHGKQERVFRAQFISNSPFTESEFSKWRQTCEAEHVEIPTVQVSSDWSPHTSALIGPGGGGQVRGHQEGADLQVQLGGRGQDPGLEG